MPAGRGRRIRSRWDGATEQEGVQAADLLRPRWYTNIKDPIQKLDPGVSRDQPVPELG
ncbi:CHRD domain-containing protein [Streptomyces azureus]|uniref:CHRD domain-containing protein n=1 Tax=Streptomyces azureus TaxID=146537 RepID=A0A0K8PGQ1_STRAJ|nr:CHRD domain-containing protein [Streptomyces azureus]